MRNCCGELLPCCVKSQQGRNQTEPQALVIGLSHTAAATGYLKLGARYYNPTTGRFTQPDPSGKEANTYNYATCNPVNSTDPTGLDAAGCWFSAGVAVGALITVVTGVETFGLGAMLGATIMSVSSDGLTADQCNLF
jgi:RHS repeat-associated protein